MKVYTKAGDKGSTSLVGGQIALKTAERINAYGTIDELNSFMGVWFDLLNSEKIEFNELCDNIFVIQKHLHMLASELATPHEKLEKFKIPIINQQCVKFLEDSIDRWDLELDPLRNFVIPGGNISSSYAHICRTVCRRAEREIVKVSKTSKLRELPLEYTNRLSDWCFVASRVICKKLSIKERVWSSDSSDAR